MVVAAKRKRAAVEPASQDLTNTKPLKQAKKTPTPTNNNTAVAVSVSVPAVAVTEKNESKSDNDTLTQSHDSSQEEEEEEEEGTERSIKTNPRPNVKGSQQQKDYDMPAQLLLISAASHRTTFERRVWALLCQIPRGRVSTYGLLAAYMKSSPRAVGNALRRNPFAPDVPCHRVVATGGALGGFKGFSSRDGEGITIKEKIKLLRGEGVRLDERWRVLGTPWSGFTE